MSSIKIGNKVIGENNPVFIIAEAGINHNGDLETAKKMIEVASEIGADAIKFQTGKVSETIIKNAPKAEYQKNSDKDEETQYEMIKQVELTDEEWLELCKFSKKKDIIFFSKPSYEGAVPLLLKMGIPVFKIGSGDVTHLSLIRKVAKTKLPIILSTGMSTMEEIKEAVDTIKGEGNKNIILLHCTSNYPTDYENVNLKAMLTLKDKFDLPVGYSDHTIGTDVPTAAVALGACVIEKHFTLDKSMKGPDHKASMEPEEFKVMVKKIRDTEKILGSADKKPTPSEKDVRSAARKSIVANSDIKKGEIIKEEHLAFKRPGIGLTQKYLKDIIGKKARTDIKKDTILDLNMID